MSRLWIGLAVALWVSTCALGADSPGQGPRRSAAAPPAPPVSAAMSSAEKATESGTAAGTRGSAGFPGTTAPGTVEPMRIAPVPVVPEKDGEHRHTRVVLPLSNVPALQLANTMTSLLRAEGQAEGRAAQAPPPSVVIVPDTVSNCLVIGGPNEAVDEVRKLVAQLDRPAAVIRLEVALGDVPAARVGSGAPVAEAEGKADPAKVQAILADPEELRKQMDILIEAQLTTLDNQPAHLQVGRREPTINSVTMTQAGRTNSLTVQNLGTMINLTPRVSPDGTVTMLIDVEDSRFAPAEEGVAIYSPSQGEPIRAPAMDSVTAKTTLRLRNGKTAVLAGMVRQPKSGKQRVILVTPHVSPIGGEAKPAR